MGIGCSKCNHDLSKCHHDLSKCHQDLQVEKKSIELFLKHTDEHHTDDLNSDYIDFKKKRPTMRSLEFYEKIYTETEGGTQKRRQRRQRRKRTRRNGLFKS